jgi:hypothetical protein
VLCKPGVRVDVRLAMFPNALAEVAARVAGFGKDSRIMTSVVRTKVTSASVRRWNLNTDRHGATWSRSVATTKIGKRISASATDRSPTLNRPSARSFFKRSRLHSQQRERLFIEAEGPRGAIGLILSGNT